MQIGSLNKRIDLQFPTRVSDSMGGWTVTHTTQASSIAAAIWPVSANELVQANAQTMVISHRIRIRYRNTVKANWRVKYGNRYFAIVSIIDPNMSHRWLDLLCKEAA